MGAGDPGLSLVGLGLLLPCQLPLKPGLSAIFNQPGHKTAEPIRGPDAGPSHPCGSQACCAGQVRAWAAGGRSMWGPWPGARDAQHWPPLPASSLPVCGAWYPRVHPVGSRTTWGLSLGEKVLKEPIPSQLEKSNRGNENP